MTVRVYRSGDASAPSIGRTTGALITLLDAVLVNGYGAKAGLGWTKSFSTTDKAMYRQGTGSTQRYLYVDDTIGANYAQVRGLSSPTSITTVDADVFSTTYRNVNKPDSGWLVVGNEKGFYLFCNRTSWGSYAASFFFGDIMSVGGTGDVGRCCLWGTTSSGGTTGPSGDAIGMMYALIFAGGKSSPGPLSEASPLLFSPASNYAAPNSFGAGFLFAPLAATYGNYAVNSRPDLRGFLPGIHRFLHAEAAVSYANGTVVNGSGLYAGKTFEVVLLWDSNISAEVRVLIETSDTWSN